MEDVISLSIGEPDFQTPWHIRDEGIKSLEKGKTWYSPNRGFMELRQEIANYYERRFGIPYDYKNQTLVTVGGSEAIDLAFRTLIQNLGLSSSFSSLTRKLERMRTWRNFSRKDEITGRKRAVASIDSPAFYLPFSLSSAISTLRPSIATLIAGSVS